MSKCIFCGTDKDDWIDVTKACEVKLSMTSTKNPVGYMTLEHGIHTVGSFEFHLTAEFKEHFHYFKDYKEKYVVLFHKPDGPLRGYFIVYMRKTI